MPFCLFVWVISDAYTTHVIYQRDGVHVVLLPPLWSCAKDIQPTGSFIPQVMEHMGRRQRIGIMGLEVV